MFNVSVMLPTQIFSSFSEQDQQGTASGFTPTSSQQVGPAGLGASFPVQGQQRFPVPLKTSQSAGFPTSQASGNFPAMPNASQPQRPGLPPAPVSSSQQPQQGFPQTSIPNQRPGFPPPPVSANQQPPQGFSQTTVPNQRPGFPPTSVSNPRPGFPPPPGFANQQPPQGFPPTSVPNQRPGFPPAPPSSNQIPGLPPAPGIRPGFPPPPPTSSPQFPAPPVSSQGQVQGFGQQSGMPPPHSIANQQPGFPPPPSMTSQHPGFPPLPVQETSPPQGFPPSQPAQRSGQSIQDFVNGPARPGMGMNAMQTGFSNMSLQVRTISFVA